MSRFFSKQVTSTKYNIKFNIYSRFCVGEQFFLVNNRIVCKKDFDSMAVGALISAAMADGGSKRPLAELTPNCDLTQFKQGGAIWGTVKHDSTEKGCSSYHLG
jgi:hypothetical protein